MTDTEVKYQLGLFLMFVCAPGTDVHTRTFFPLRIRHQTKADQSREGLLGCASVCTENPWLWCGDLHAV